MNQKQLTKHSAVDLQSFIRFAEKHYVSVSF